MPESADPYLDPTTGVLRNLLGATTQQALRTSEAEFVGTRQLLADRAQIARSNDLAELRAIHRHLFQDVYDWAGQLRTVDIRKSTGAPFLPVSMLQRSAEFAAAALREDSFLQQMQHDRFVERLAFHYDQFNYLHPFREGNGRTQRLFWSRVSRDAGWAIDWLVVTGEVNDAACLAASDDGKLDPLIAMFDGAVRPLLEQQPHREGQGLERDG